MNEEYEKLPEFIKPFVNSIEFGTGNIKMFYKKVTNCQSCPLCNNDNEYGYDRCNLDINIHMNKFEQMPLENIHISCPLKENNITFGLK